MLLIHYNNKLVTKSGTPALNIQNSLIDIGLLQFSLQNKFILTHIKPLYFKNVNLEQELLLQNIGK